VSRITIALAKLFSARMLDPGKQNRRMQFDALPPPPDRVLFLGDSITEGAEWTEWFPDLPSLNRGIGGDTVRGVIARLDTAINQPRLISLLIGTNDIGGIGETADPDLIAGATHQLVTALKSATPGTPILLTSVMPRGRSFARAITRLNELNQAMAEAEGLTYIDVYDQLADPDGEIGKAFSNDRLHLTGAGYRVWVDALRPHLGGA